MTNHILPEKLKVLVTGTQGRVGQAILPGLSRLFQVTEFDKVFDKNGPEHQIPGDITEFQTVLGAVKKVKPDCIVHLAANANQDAPEEEIVKPNYLGLRNVYKAAAACHVPKMVFASSLYTLSGYPGFPNKSPFDDGRKFNPDDPTHPGGNPYGESKVWGENLAQEYYDQFGIKTIVLRIGDLNSDNKPAEAPSSHLAPIWLSHSDAVQIFAKAIITDVQEPVGVYFAISGRDSPYNIQPTINDLGYEPDQSAKE